ncbi:MAG: elongation factor G [Chromatiales bacterium]|nr:elongation factor G [Chromatiales bacterium]
MPSYSTADIRNIALVGQSGSGKTTLVEALLYASGSLPNAGSVEKGDTVSDFDPLEKRYLHSLNATVESIDLKDCHINLVDTPGDPDFIGRALAALPAVETVAIVVNAQSGIETVTRRMMQVVRDHGMACMLIVNHIDANVAGLESVLLDLQSHFGGECLPVNLPAGKATQVLDCFAKDSGEADFSSVGDAHTALMDQVVEVDEDLMEKYLDEGDVDPRQLHAPFEQALREGHLIPVCFVSAASGAGVQELLEVFSNLAPNPLEGTPHVFVRGKGDKAERLLATPDEDKPVLAHVFKVEYDPFVGKMGLMRVHRGVVNKGSQLLIDDGAHSFKVAHLFRIQGKEHYEMNKAIPGDICAVAKVEDLHQDAILHGNHDEDDLRAEPMEYPTPLVGVALEAESRGDEQKVSDVLHKIVAEDPCLRIEHDIAANETVLRGLGDFHLRVALEKMDDRYHVRVATHPPSIPYRETITRPAEGHYRHKKQTGGAGQFGEVFLKVEPMERGGGFEFVDRVTGGAIPGQFIPAVEKGIRQLLETGAVAGYPLVDLRVVVTDGKHHSVDSKEIAFVVAGRKAFMDAIANAGAALLEPIVRMEVNAPDSAVGDITGDLSQRRGRINQTDTNAAGQMVIGAEAPLAELENFAARLKSFTGGAGSYSMQFDHYEPAPPNVQRELMQRYVAKDED